MSKEADWMADGGELMENLGSRVQILSNSSSSQSSHNQQPVRTVIGSNEVLYDHDHGIPVSKSCDDLISDHADNKEPISRSLSCLSLSVGKYDYVQSKIKQYIDVLNPGQNDLPKQFVSTIKATKEEYLEEINNRLMRELEEKNATLQQLQENYEHLLLKYAEAQNKIDNLRFQSSAITGESSSRSKYKPKLMIKNVAKPAVYQYKKPADKEESMEKIDRPSTLAVETLTRTSERDGLKAVTPTDSEGVSSVVTSMSGHSKILSNFDDSDKKATTLKSDILEQNLPANDPFDKVKHWQSSLPPLDMIETPDTSLYDLEPATPSTRYNELPVSDLENIPETPEWAAQTKAASQMGMKKYLRTLSLPSSLTRRNILSQIYKRRNIHTIDVSSPVECGSVYIEQENTIRALTPPSSPPPPPDPETHCNVIRRKKRPPFLRSASLPVYDYETPRSVIRCHVPPLDLENLTLSEDETLSKSNQMTSSSFVTNHDCSFQTLNSLNSCMATISDYSLSRHNLPSNLHKSTSITPDRSREMLLFEESREYCCNVCGEILMPGKAASFHGIHVTSQDGSSARLPICRSFSFNTATTSPTRFSSLTSQDPSESFDAYTNNLKTRSQITLKALTAHVNNS